jgi:hypothetical protein
LLAEIQEEEKECEQVAKAVEQKLPQKIEDDFEEVPILIVPAESDTD